MSGFFIHLESKTQKNENYREVLYTASHSQLVVMSLLPQEEIGMEVHHDRDQFIRIEKGEARAILDGEEFELEDGDAIVIPAGTNHNIINASKKNKVKLYSVYSPSEHPDGTIHRTKADAEADEHDHE